MIIGCKKRTYFQLWMRWPCYNFHIISKLFFLKLPCFSRIFSVLTAIEHISLALVGSKTNDSLKQTGNFFFFAKLYCSAQGPSLSIYFLTHKSSIHYFRDYFLQNHFLWFLQFIWILFHTFPSQVHIVKA